MWMGFAMSGGVPNRIEFGKPIYGTLYGTVRSPSDARLKTDVRELHDVLDRLGSLRGVSYVRHQQQGMARANTVLLVEAVKGLHGENRSLQRRLAALEAQVGGRD